MKVLLTFIGRSGSNLSVFYLYRATNMGLSSTPYYVHVQLSKGVWLKYNKVRTPHLGVPLQIFIHIAPKGPFFWKKITRWKNKENPSVLTLWSILFSHQYIQQINATNVILISVKYPSSECTQISKVLLSSEDDQWVLTSRPNRCVQNNII